MTEDASGDGALRQELVFHLTKGHAHMPLLSAIADFPLERINEVFPNGSYSAWGLLEHIRIAQADILEFIRNPAYVYPQWPDDYWPDPAKQASAEDWQETLDGYLRDRDELAALVMNPATDLYARIPWGEGQTILREIMVVTDHNAYHVGEFAIMRQVMETWPEEHA